MVLISVTVDDVMSWKPCKEYTRERVTALFAGRETITALDVLDMDIPARDRLQVVLREGMLPATTLHVFICRAAETLLLQERAAGREPDPRSWEAIAAKRAWLRGELSDEKLEAAYDAAGWVQPQYLGHEWNLAHKAAWAAVWAADCPSPERVKSPSARLSLAASEVARCAASYFARLAHEDAREKAKEMSRGVHAVSPDSRWAIFDSSDLAEAQAAWVEKATHQIAARAGDEAVCKILKEAMK